MPETSGASQTIVIDANLAVWNVLPLLADHDVTERFRRWRAEGRRLIAPALDLGVREHADQRADLAEADDAGLVDKEEAVVGVAVRLRLGGRLEPWHPIADAYILSELAGKELPASA